MMRAGFAGVASGSTPVFMDARLSGLGLGYALAQEPMSASFTIGVSSLRQALAATIVMNPEKFVRGGIRCFDHTAWANTAAAYQSLPPKLQEIANNLWAVHKQCVRYSVPTKAASDKLKRYFDVFTSTVYETEHLVLRVPPGTGERTLVLGRFLRRFVDLPQTDSKQLFALLQGYVTRLENTVRLRWSVGDVAIWDNRATQHVAIDHYGKRPRLHRRVTVAGDVPVSIDVVEAGFSRRSQHNESRWTAAAS